MRLDGVGRLTRKLNASPERLRRGAAESLSGIGDDLKGRSQSQAPYRPGGSDHLRDHAYSEVSRDRRGASLEVGYDGPDGYLFVQHEGMWQNFLGHQGPKEIENWTTAGTGPKFLEGPFVANKERYKRELAAALRRALGR